MVYESAPIELKCGSLFGKASFCWWRVCSTNPTYLLCLLRSGGSIANKWLLAPTRAWAAPSLMDIWNTLHRSIFATKTDFGFFKSLSFRRHGRLSIVRMLSPSFQRSLRRSASAFHDYGNPDRSSLLSYQLRRELVIIVRVESQWISCLVTTWPGARFRKKVWQILNQNLNSRLSNSLLFWVGQLWLVKLSFLFQNRY